MDRRNSSRFSFFAALMIVALMNFQTALAENTNVKIDKNILQKVQLQAQQLANTINIKNKIVPQLKKYLQNNPHVYGASFTFAPIQKKHRTLKYAPYVYRQGNKLVAIDLAKNYDYTQQNWYTVPVSLKKAIWSKPYFDQGGGNAWMVTYSIPVYADRAKEKLIGVVTNDVLASK
jgi:sigma-B regulation protein RsbU (phosphoserine phosphatase)